MLGFRRNRFQGVSWSETQNTDVHQVWVFPSLLTVPTLVISKGDRFQIPIPTPVNEIASHICITRCICMICFESSWLFWPKRAEKYLLLFKSGTWCVSWRISGICWCVGAIIFASLEMTRWVCYLCKLGFQRMPLNNNRTGPDHNAGIMLQKISFKLWVLQDCLNQALLIHIFQQRTDVPNVFWISCC